MKALLLDAFTTQAISMVYSHSQLLESEFYLVERLGNQQKHESMYHFVGVVFVQPNRTNIELLVREVQNPKFSEYHIYFSNSVAPELLTRLGKADVKEVVKQVQEFYCDFLPVNDDLFHVGASNSLLLSSPPGRTLDRASTFDKNLNGLTAALLALKLKPTRIRYQGASELARNLALKLQQRTTDPELFQFGGAHDALVLILDRRDDPMTPLLTQWTYQAMVHELLGINNNRVDLSRAPGVKKDMHEVVLAAAQDTFFSTNRLANFGDLGVAVKDMLDEYQKRVRTNERITSIEDMQAFVERFPAFRQRSISVAKHVALIGELARLTDDFKLFDLSELEQDMACNSDHTAHHKRLMEVIQRPQTQVGDLLRLVLIYLLRYESYGEANALKQQLSLRGVGNAQLALLDAFTSYCGAARRAPGLFDGGSIMQQLQKHINTSIHGVSNVYTQHEPLLAHTLRALSSGSLSSSTMPDISLGRSLSSALPPGVSLAGGISGDGPILRKGGDDVLVYIIGGVTFEEARCVSAFNASPEAATAAGGGRARIILGGSVVHNSASFLHEIKANFARPPRG